MDTLETNIIKDEFSDSPDPRYSAPAAFAVWFAVVAPKNLLKIWINFLHANLHYFAIGLLLRTLFSPWHKDTTGYGRGFDLGRYSQVFIMNLVSRGVGFVVRLTTILFGLVSEILFFLIGLLLLIFWFLSPAILLIAIFVGLRLLSGF